MPAAIELELFRHGYTETMQFADRLIKERVGRNAPTRTALWAPHPELETCVRAYVTRNTVGASLSETDRLNYFPAAPTCSITWFLKGDYVHLDLTGAPRYTDMPGPVMFTGPRTKPVVSRNSGEVDAFMVMFQPDALHALVGLDVAAQVDRDCAAADVLDSDWIGMTQDVLRAPHNDMRIQLVEEFLLPRWQALGQAHEPSGGSIRHWAHDLHERALNHAQGRSERQIDRRIKDWAGQPLRQLRGIGRTEDTLLQARAALDADQLKWADIAATVGFSDQAHLSREFRRVTGLTPRDLKSVLAHESFWIYDLWT